MFSIKLTSILVLILTTSPIQSVYECCPEDNILSMITKNCSTDDLISLECKGYRIPVLDVLQFKEFNFLLMENGTLIDQNDNEEIKYCHSYPHDDSKNSSSHIYIICQDNGEEQTFEGHTIRLAAILGYISVTFTILTIVVYAMVPKLLDLQGISIIHTLTGLAAGYTFLGAIQLTTYMADTICSTMAFLTYFCFLYMFFWLNTLSFHIWRTTIKLHYFKESRWAIIYHIFAIGGSLVFLILLLIAHYSTAEFWDDIKPGIGLTSCWFHSMRETMIFFYGPIIVLLFFNAFFYLWTVLILWRQAENTQNKILKYRLMLCLRLFIIMGITWFFEIITAVMKNPQMALSGKIMFFLLDLFNILQGVLIFMVLVVFRRRVRRALASKNLCNIQFPNSWKYLEDEEMESVEIRANSTIAEYKGDEVEIKR